MSSIRLRTIRKIGAFYPDHVGTRPIPRAQLDLALLRAIGDGAIVGEYLCPDADGVVGVHVVKHARIDGRGPDIVGVVVPVSYPKPRPVLAIVRGAAGGIVGVGVGKEGAERVLVPRSRGCGYDRHVFLGRRHHLSVGLAMRQVVEILGIQAGGLCRKGEQHG